VVGTAEPSTAIRQVPLVAGPVFSRQVPAMLSSTRPDRGSVRLTLPQSTNVLLFAARSQPPTPFDERPTVKAPRPAPPTVFASSAFFALATESPGARLVTCLLA